MATKKGTHMAAVKEDGIRTCTVHFKKVDNDGICSWCRPHIDTRTDTEYEKARNTLIPEAIWQARKRIKHKKSEFELRPGVDGRDYKHDFFTEFYCLAMTDLVGEYRLRESK